MLFPIKTRDYYKAYQGEGERTKNEIQYRLRKDTQTRRCSIKLSADKITEVSIVKKVKAFTTSPEGSSPTIPISVIM